MTAGYSGTPLGKKLGIKPGVNCLILNHPDNYLELIADAPVSELNIDFESNQKEYDFIHLFTQRKSDLEKSWKTMRSLLTKTGSLWISWPKGSSKLEKDLNENDVRAIGLKGGLVDVKVCAVDENWSGLKFMYRRKDR